MRVLGIDCGTERTGYGIIDSDGRAHRLVTAGTLRTSPKMPLADRLYKIACELRAVVQRFQPEAAAVEEVFHAVNAKSALKLAHVRGVVLMITAECGVPCGERLVTTRLKIGPLLKNQNDTGKAPVELSRVDRAPPLRGIVQMRVAVAKSFQHHEVVEIPEDNRRQRHRAEIRRLFTVPLCSEPLETCGPQQVACFGAITTDAALDAQFLERNITTVVGEDHRQRSGAALDGL